MKKTLLLGLALIGSQVAFSQRFKSEQPVIVQTSENWSFPEIENFDGSYQFIVKAKKKFLITDETFELIESSRKDDSDVELTLNPYLSVIILSKRKTSDPSAVRFTEVYTLNH